MCYAWSSWQWWSGGRWWRPWWLLFGSAASGVQGTDVNTDKSTGTPAVTAEDKAAKGVWDWLFNQWTGGTTSTLSLRVEKLLLWTQTHHFFDSLIIYHGSPCSFCVRSFIYLITWLPVQIKVAFSDLSSHTQTPILTCFNSYCTAQRAE